MFKTFMFLDFETTGLVDPEVTEVCVLAIDRTCPTRVRDKFVCCCDSSKQIEESVASLTGLTNEMIVGRRKFVDCMDALTMFIQLLPPPVCMMAHNGSAFDFRLLHSAAEKHGSFPCDVYAIDTLDLFREMDASNGIHHHSYKLGAIRNRLFGTAGSDRDHGAEADCETLAKCFIEMKGIDYVDKHFTLPIIHQDYDDNN